MDTVHDNPALDFIKLQLALQMPKDDKALFDAIVNAPFEQKLQTTLMYLGIIVFLLADRTNKTINRITLSDTDMSKNALTVSTIPFHKIRIPFSASNNIIIQSLRHNKPQDTTDWKFLFEPALDAAAARFNQASAGIAYSAVYPVAARDGGALIYSYFQYRQAIGKPQYDFMDKYSKLVDEQLRARS
jgi:hypothetical protein